MAANSDDTPLLGVRPNMHGLYGDTFRRIYTFVLQCMAFFTGSVIADIILHSNIIYSNMMSWRALFSLSYIKDQASYTLFGVLILRCIVYGLASAPKRFRGFIPVLFYPLNLSNNVLTASETEAENPVSASFSEAKFGSFSEAKIAIAANLRARIARLHLRSAAILAAIGIALVAAATIIVIAGNLTGIDVNAVSSVDKLKTEITETASKVAKLRRVELLRSQLKKIENSTTEDDVKATADLRRQLIQLGEFLYLDELGISEVISSEIKNIETLRQNYNAAWQKEIETSKGYSDWHFLAATAITRIGVVLILIFLVQILIGLYRYNVRLATSYTSLLYFIYAWDGKSNNVNTLLKVFGPPRVEFGKEPRSAFEALASAVGGKVGKRLDRKDGAARSGESG